MTSERRRDALGRPLSAGADADLTAEPVVDATTLSDAQAWSTAIDYLDRGLPFHAHEVFEQRWRSSGPGHKAVWRALAQWGAALTHAARGNQVGARRLAERTLAGLGDTTTLPAGVEIDRVRASCEALLRS